MHPHIYIECTHAIFAIAFDHHTMPGCWIGFDAHPFVGWIYQHAAEFYSASDCGHGVGNVGARFVPALGDSLVGVGANPRCLWFPYPFDDLVCHDRDTRRVVSTDDGCRRNAQ